MISLNAFLNTLYVIFLKNLIKHLTQRKGVVMGFLLQEMWHYY